MPGLGAAALVIAMLVLAPVIAAHTLNVLAAVFVTAPKPLGRLARGNLARNPRHTANTAGALMIGMALVGAASVLAASTTASTRSILQSESTADFVVQSAIGTVPAGAVQGISSRLGFRRRRGQLRAGGTHVCPKCAHEARSWVGPGPAIGT